MVFSGQGSQYVGMGQKLYNEEKIVKEIFEEASDVLHLDMKHLCFESDNETLKLTENTQPALVTCEYAMFKIFEKKFGYHPECLAGHSLGEITALACAGAISFVDAISIARSRGNFMQNAVESGVGSMAAISKVEQSIVEELCIKYQGENDYVAIANENSKFQTVISGYTETVDKVCKDALKYNAAVNKLNVSTPFHCKLMQSAADKMHDELLKYNFQSLQIPVFSNVNASYYQSEKEIGDMLTKQITSKVMWSTIMSKMVEYKIDTIIEIGPKSVLRNLAKKEGIFAEYYSFDDNKDYIELENKKKENRITFLIRCLAIAICTKNRNWNNEEYQNGVVIPYQKVNSMLQKIEEDNENPTDEQMQMAADMLKSTFQTKQVTEEEKMARFKQISNETEDKFYHFFI